MSRSRRPDPSTLDLFRDFEPAPVVERFREEDVQSWTLSGKLCRAVSRALDDCGLSREAVAGQMTEFLKERVSKAMLDAYASQGRETHQISAARLIALVVVTGDVRVVNALLQDAKLIAVPAKYEALIKREVAAEAVERAERARQAADAEWRAKR